WTVRADMPQSFHIEGVSFLIRNVNGAMPFPEDRGWKDTVWVDGQVELLVYYGQPSWPHFPFYFNSQTLEMAEPRLDWANAGESSVVKRPSTGLNSADPSGFSGRSKQRGKQQTQLREVANHRHDHKECQKHR
ncbi:hypothetical protein LFZ31_04795, partial [Salmonella enterica subsp. enterica serovar Newport str. S09097]